MGTTLGGDVRAGAARAAGLAAVLAGGLVSAFVLLPGTARAAGCDGTALEVRWDGSAGEPTGDTDALVVQPLYGRGDNGVLVLPAAGYTDPSGRPATVSVTSLRIRTEAHPEGFDVPAPDDGESWGWSGSDALVAGAATGCAVVPGADLTPTTTAPPTTAPPTPVTPSVPGTTEPPSPVPPPTTSAPAPGAPADVRPIPAPPATAPPTPEGAAVPAVPARSVQVFTGGGFAPGELVRGTLHSTPVDLGLVTADARGTATFVVALPAGLEGGRHTVTMVGLGSGRGTSAAFSLTPGTASPGPSLAYTGASPAAPLALGVALLVAGGVLVTASRRRS